MKLPTEIYGRHKIRDAHICLLWDREVMTVPELAELKGFTERYIYKILSRNSMFIKVDKDWEKSKRIHQLKVLVKKSKESKKDKADLIEQLRREIEGNSPLVKIENTVSVNNFKQFIESEYARSNGTKQRTSITE